MAHQSTHDAIRTIENAGKYLVKDRKLAKQIAKLTAIDAAKNSNPEIQVFAILSVVLSRVVSVPDDGWVSEICTILNLKPSFNICPNCDYSKDSIVYCDACKGGN